MPKSLLIVESPAKARTLERYLGKDFIVRASVGHVKDLPKNKLGIDVEKGFEPEYQVIRDKKKIVKELRDAAAEVQSIYLGPDPDREGEAIAWHIAEELDVGEKPLRRVLFYELTKKAIQEALANPATLNRGLFDAQQARRTLDRLVGYLISPLLWEKVKKGLSAGRVQSVALRLICERERSIQKFDPEEYWTIEAMFSPEGTGSDISDKKECRSFGASLWRSKQKKVSIGTGEEANGLVEQLRPLTFQVSKVERKKKKRNPSPPFITSTMQQDAARKLHFSARQTMGVAQKLYEGLEIGEDGAVGLITYMRTDSTRLSQEAVQAVREYITETWGSDYVPAKAASYKSKESAQDAHEAIRPTDVKRTPEKMAPHLTKEQLKLYTLVWKRFVACQMSPAEIAQTTVDIGAGDFVLRASGSVIEFPGFMTLYVEGKDNGDGREDGDSWLPELAEGQPLSLLEITPGQHFTQPPPHFTEASLIRELEELGIGRPSTYATILSTITSREYITQEKQRLHPTELGWIIDMLLEQNFPNIVDVDFTAKMEKSLDEIAEGRCAYPELLSEFYGAFAKTLDLAKSNMMNLKSAGWPTDLTCPRCSNPLHIRWSRNGPFLACSAYPECQYSSNYERDEKGKVHPVENAVETGETCEKCGRPMILKHGRFGVFLACSGYPECKNARPRGTGVPCPREGCGGEIVERIARTGRRFFGCNHYPECKTIFRGRPVLKDCPVCGGHIMIEKESVRVGLRLACPNPSCKHVESAEGGDEHQAVEGK
ncbi:MAG: type I DNA topoisomerase [Syntrophobacteraceae bacterium]|nr:type I DNA topoisomerase [Desulfobacteraceae bacterium]